MEMPTTEAEALAIDFLVSEWEFSPEDQEWLAVLSCKPMGESWYVVEVGVEGLPDKWVIQVYDTGECDPSYTFASPIKASDGNNDLEAMPDRIAEVLTSERHSGTPV